MRNPTPTYHESVTFCNYNFVEAGETLDQTGGEGNVENSWPELNLSQSGRDALLGSTIVAVVVGEAATGNVPAIAATAQIAGSVANIVLWYDSSADHFNNQEKTTGDWVQWGSNTAATYLGIIPFFTIPAVAYSVIDEYGGFDIIWNLFD